VTTFFRTRAVLTPATAAAAFAAALSVTLGAFGTLAWALCEPATGGSLSFAEVLHPLLAIAVFFIGYDVALGVVIIATLVAAFSRKATTATTASASAVSVQTLPEPPCQS